jgi:4-amino-4-deoxy-L-arabinose transferase-like glycosyltransferase
VTALTPAWAGRPLAGPLEALRRHRSLAWARAHRSDLVVLAPLLVVVGVVNAVGMGAFPGHLNDDEGTYVAQAWAVVTQGSLAHYTYAYDHPPLGWITIAAWAALTDGYARVSSALMVGREAMLICTAVSTAFVYALARRTGLPRWAAGTAVVLFGLSPVALQFHRMVFLDNLSTMWVLAALVLASSRRQSLAAAVAAGTCFGAAVLTKETFVVLLPALVYALAQHSNRSTRRWRMPAAAAASFAVVAFYPLYAMVKSELVPGPGHVSLIGAALWQLTGRAGSGSVFDPTSGASQLVTGWLGVDAWLLLGGLVLAPVAVVHRQARPVVLSLVLLVAVLLRGGYLPYPYVIAFLPFDALVVATAATLVWRWSGRATALRGGPAALRFALRWIAPLVPVALAMTLVVAVAPGWARSAGHAMTARDTEPVVQATAWIEANVDKDAVIIVDDYVWTDLAEAGFTKRVWTYKADLDPAVQRELLPDGWRSVQYVALPARAKDTLAELPTVQATLEHSVVVADFGHGELVVRRVVP